MLFLSALNITFLFLFLLYDRRLFSGNIFSPGSIFIYFAALPAFSNLYFSIFQDSFNDIVLDQIAGVYQDHFYVNAALIMAIISNILTYFGIVIGYRSKSKVFSFVLNRLFLLRAFERISDSDNERDKIVLSFGFMVFLLGLVAYFIFLQKIGGLVALWAELWLRAEKNAGLGYLQTFYMIAVQLGLILVLSVTFKKSQKTLSALLILLGIIIQGSMGARGPVVIFLVSVLLMYHFKINRITRLLNPKILLISLIIPVFVVVMLQFRQNSFETLSQDPSSLASNSIESLESGFIARIGRLERDVVILKYFADHDFWWGKSYLGLLYAPIPRSIFPEKPPNDTGMYLRVMALGETIDPPQPITSLGSSGWPEGNWAGYMNWGFPGFILLFFLSGYLLGKFYRYLVKYSFPVLGTCIFAVLAVGGPPLFSVKALIDLGMTFFYVSLLVIVLLHPAKMFLPISRYFTFPKRRRFASRLAAGINTTTPRRTE